MIYMCLYCKLYNGHIIYVQIEGKREIIEGCGGSRENVDKGKGEGGRRRRGAVRI